VVLCFFLQTVGRRCNEEKMKLGVYGQNCSQSTKFFRLAFFCIFLLCLCVKVYGDDKDGSTPQVLSIAGEENEAIEQNEVWRELKEGEHIPPGSHVRVDMSGNGKKFVKISDVVKTVNNATNNTASILLMERVLNNLPNVDKQLEYVNSLKHTDIDQYHKELRLLWEKRQVELVEVMNAVADEPELISGYLDVVKQNNATDADLIASLLELENFVESIDNALDFCKMGGLGYVRERLSSNSPGVRAAAAYVIGSASKSLKSIQDQAREEMVLDKLVHVFQNTECSEDTEREKECAKLLYAISALIRGNDNSKAAIAQSGFVNTLVKLLDDPDVTLSDHKLRSKAAALLTDILIEAKVNSCGGDETEAEAVIIPTKTESSNEAPAGDESLSCPDDNTPLLSQSIENCKKTLCFLVEENLAAVNKFYAEQRSIQVSIIEALEEKLRILAKELCVNIQLN